MIEISASLNDIQFLKVSLRLKEKTNETDKRHFSSFAKENKNKMAPTCPNSF